MKWRRLTRLEGMLLGALLELTEGKAPARDALEQPMCCRGLTTLDACGRCGPLLRGHELVEKVLKMQRRRKPRPTRKPAPRGSGRRRFPDVSKMNLADDGRGGHRVGERRQAARTMHIIDADSSARDVELARADLVGFFGDVLDKHHGGSF